MLPSVVVVGAQRCGTTTLYRLLRDHPQVVRPAFRKGIGYFDLEFERGERWYRGHFPVERVAAVRTVRHGPPVTFEISGYYLFHPLAAERMAASLPGVRVVAMVRDPCERAYSAYRHEYARGFEHETFEDALDLEPQRLAGEVERMVADPTYRSHSHRHHAYVGRSQYAPQLQRMAAAVGRDRVLTLDADRFFADPGREFAHLVDWLGLTPWTPSDVGVFNARPGKPMSPALRRRLMTSFEESDSQMHEFLGREPSWRT
jgi:hypothetical protein